MGAPFARRLMAAGHTLHVCDARDETAARFGESGGIAHVTPQAVAAAADIVFLSLPTPAIVEQVALAAGAATAERKLRYLIDLSTTGPVMARSLAQRLAAVEIDYIDAPVSGGVPGAVAGTVVIMLACSDELANMATPLLSHLGRVFHVGRSAGQGQVTKVLNNMLSAGALLLSGEVAALGVKAGVD